MKDINSVQISQACETSKKLMARSLSLHVQAAKLDDIKMLEMKYRQLLIDYEIIKNQLKNQCEENAVLRTELATLRSKAEEALANANSQPVETQPTVSDPPCHEPTSQEAIFITITQAEPVLTVMKYAMEQGNSTPCSLKLVQGSSTPNSQKLVYTPQTRERFDTFQMFAPSVMNMFLNETEGKQQEKETNQQANQDNQEKYEDSEELKDKVPQMTDKKTPKHKPLNVGFMDECFTNDKAKQNEESQNNLSPSVRKPLQNQCQPQQDQDEDIPRAGSLPLNLKTVRFVKKASQEQIKRHLDDHKYYKAQLKLDDGHRQIIKELDKLKEKTKRSQNPILLGLICLFLTIFIKMIPEK